MNLLSKIRSLFPEDNSPWFSDMVLLDTFYNDNWFYDKERKEIVLEGSKKIWNYAIIKTLRTNYRFSAVK